MLIQAFFPSKGCSGWVPVKRSGIEKCLSVVCSEFIFMVHVPSVNKWYTDSRQFNEMSEYP